MASVRVDTLLDAREAGLALELVGGRGGLSRRISGPRIQKPGLALTGYTAYVHSEWEPERTAAGDGRPVRRYYEVTAAGARALDGAIEQVRAIGGLRRLAPKGAR